MAIQLVKMGIYNTLTDEKMVTLGGSIVSDMEANVPIPEVVPLVVTVKDNYKDYVESFNEAKGRSTIAIVRKRETKSLLADSLVRLAIAVNYFAGGNMEILSKTGMPPEKAKGGKHKKVLLKPEGVTAVNCGNSGCIKVKVKTAIGADSFVYEWTAEPVTNNSVWTSKGRKMKSYIWEGLTPGTRIHFRVIAIGSGGQSLTSDVVTCMVI